MPPEPYEVLLNKARADADAWVVLGKDSGIADEMLGFHAQQAVEKAIKAVLCFRAIKYPYTHDVGHLLRLAAAHGVDLPLDAGQWDRLTPYATVLRYDADPPGPPEPLDRDWAQGSVDAAIGWALNATGKV